MKTGIPVNDFWLDPAGDIFVVGNKGAIIRYNSSIQRWVPMASGIDMGPNLAYNLDLYSVWGTSSSNLYAVGGGFTVSGDGSPTETGIILHYDGSGDTWTTVYSGGTTLYDISGANSSLIFAVRRSGTDS